MIFLVFEPKYGPRTAPALADAERVVFLREKFSWPALFFGPFWLLGTGYGSRSCCGSSPPSRSAFSMASLKFPNSMMSAVILGPVADRRVRGNDNSPRQVPAQRHARGRRRDRARYRDRRAALFRRVGPSALELPRPSGRLPRRAPCRRSLPRRCSACFRSPERTDDRRRGRLRLGQSALGRQGAGARLARERGERARFW